MSCALQRRIPPEYLQKISAKDYKTWQKEKAEQDKKKAEARAKAKKAKN